MRRLKITLIAILGLCFSTQAQTWNEVTTDETGDGANANLLDGTRLEYYHDADADSVWFRVTTTGINSTQEKAVGVNIMVNIPNAGSTFNFWGDDNQNAFHKLVTAWVTGTPPSSYSGTIGVGDATGVAAQNYNNLSSNNLDVTVNTTDKTIVIGMKREDLVTDSEMGGSSVTMAVAAAVGSNESWNDDIYSSTGTMTVTGNVDVEEVQSNQLNIYPNPASGIVHVSSETNESVVGLKLMDATGSTVLSLEPNAGNVRLDLSEMQAGMYVLIMETESGLLMSKKLVLAR